MRTANDLIDDLLHYTQPPRGCAVSVTDADGEPNWIAGMARTETSTSVRFQQRVWELRRSDPCVDWSAVTDRLCDRRRIGKRLSEIV